MAGTQVDAPVPAPLPLAVQDGTNRQRGVVAGGWVSLVEEAEVTPVQSAVEAEATVTLVRTTSIMTKVLFDSNVEHRPNPPHVTSAFCCQLVLHVVSRIDRRRDTSGRPCLYENPGGGLKRKQRSTTVIAYGRCVPRWDTIFGPALLGEGRGSRRETGAAMLAWRRPEATARGADPASQVSV